MTGAAAGTDDQAGWQSRLEPGETLLWQGRPDGRLVFVWRHAVEAVLALAFGFGMLILLGMFVLLLPQLVAMAVLPGVVFFGLVAFFLGPWLHLRDARRRRNTRYALTTRRAIIARSDRTGRVTVQSYPISADSPIGTAWNGVTFARARVRSGGRSHDVDIGFERIGDAARTVHDHLLAIKRGLVAERT
ncbi:hypothetical protein [Pararhodobacter marinus]|uniref:hypothetical protein n=1 Tax=Pararhodobacter marinus TaxID=2184063 RepID=UPI003515D261